MNHFEIFKRNEITINRKGVEGIVKYSICLRDKQMRFLSCDTTYINSATVRKALKEIDLEVVQMLVFDFKKDLNRAIALLSNNVIKNELYEIAISAQ